MITEKAHAKINLVLDVIGKRPDNYHDLRMVMTTIDLYDRLTFEVISEDKIILSTNRYYLPNDDRNLVYKTAKLIKDMYAINVGLKIHIHKSIPVAAGLAGGSTDAASTIKALNQLFKLNMDMDKMMEIGKQIGSDVPFCLYGKTALVEGVGDIITPLPFVPRCWVVLVKPHFGVSTKEIFQNVKLEGINHPDVDQVVNAIKNNDYYGMCQHAGNSLESITFTLYPEVERIKQKLLSLGVDLALMSGSGPTLYALVLNEERAKRIKNSFDKKRYEVYAVRIRG